MAAKERVVGSPVALGLIAGGITCGIAYLMKKRTTERRLDERDYGEYAEGLGYERRQEGYVRRDEMEPEFPIPGRAERIKAAAREKVSEVKEGVKTKVEEMKERTSELRERIPSTEEVRQRALAAKTRAGDVYDRASQEHPAILALISLLAGAAIGFLIPVSDRERRMIAPVRERARDLEHDLEDKLHGKIASFRGDLEQKVDSLGQRVQQRVAGQKNLATSATGMPTPSTKLPS